MTTFIPPTDRALKPDHGSIAGARSIIDPLEPTMPPRHPGLEHVIDAPASGGADFEPAAGAFSGGNVTPAAGLIAPEAMERWEAIRTVEMAVRSRGLTISAACRETGLPRVNFDRWQARVKSGGIEALQDNYANCGRRPLATLDEQELLAARQLYTQTGSATLALRMLANTAGCREEVADVILKQRRSKHTLTPTLRGQVVVPDAVLDWHKSPKKVRRESFITPRNLSFLDRSGGEQRLLPGMLAERDDMSNNFIFWIDWPWGGDPCSDKFGVRIARGQNLLHLDAGSLRFLSFLMLVRLRDSYRADDIWQWVGQTYRDIGIPEIGERWERGIWQANQLHGTPIESGHTGQEQRLGGIQALGRKIQTSQSPTTKIIENRFRFFQRVCNTIPGQIGAKRGEMEAVTKLWTACRAGHRDPRDYFLSYEDTCKQIEAKLQYVNSEQVEGSIYQGIPNEIWHREGGDQRMTRLSAEQSYLFARDRHVVTISKGHALVRKTAPDGVRMGWWFHNEELWRMEGRRIALFMDDFAPASGATLVIADGREAGKVIGQADLVEGCPQFALGNDTATGAAAQAGVDALDRRKAFTDAVRGEYRALGLRKTIARGTYASDGRGRVARAEQTSNPLDPAPRSRKPEFVEPDLDEIDRLEAQAFKRGDLVPH